MRPGPEEVAETDGVLTAEGEAHEFHTYEGAGHAFFAVDRPSYRPHGARMAGGVRRGWSERHWTS